MITFLLPSFFLPPLSLQHTKLLTLMEQSAEAVAASRPLRREKWTRTHQSVNKSQSEEHLQVGCSVQFTPAPLPDHSYCTVSRVPVLQAFVFFFYNSVRHNLTKWLSFCSSFNALSTDASFIKIGVCCRELLTLEFNLYYWYSTHSVHIECPVLRVYECQVNTWRLHIFPWALTSFPGLPGFPKVGCGLGMRLLFPERIHTYVWFTNTRPVAEHQTSSLAVVLSFAILLLQATRTGLIKLWVILDVSLL